MSLGSRSSLGLGRSFGGGVKLDLSVRLSPQLVDGWINHCRHVLRVGLRAYQFKEWCASSRHELLEIPSPLNWFQKSIGVMLVIGLLPLPPLPLCALVLLIVLLTGNIKILLVLVAFGPGAPLSVPTSPLRVLLPPFLLASAGLLGKTHKLSNRSVFGSLSSSPSFGRFNMVNPCLSLLSGSPYLVPVVGCLAISMVTPFCVLHLSH